MERTCGAAVVPPSIPGALGRARTSTSSRHMGRVALVSHVTQERRSQVGSVASALGNAIGGPRTAGRSYDQCYGIQPQRVRASKIAVQ